MRKNKKTTRVLISNHTNQLLTREKQSFSVPRKFLIFVESKRSQIAATLVWFLAFVVIFFIILLFVTASLIIAGTKKVPIIGKGESRVGIEEETRGNLILAKQISSFLNTPVLIEGKREKMYELIISSKINEIRKPGYFINKDENSEEIQKIKSKSDMFNYMAEEIFSKTLGKDLWQLIVNTKEEKRFTIKSGLYREGDTTYFASGNLLVCAKENEVIYSEISLDSNISLFLCFNIKDFESMRKK